jgi:hypothetical protein
MVPVEITKLVRVGFRLLISQHGQMSDVAASFWNPELKTKKVKLIHTRRVLPNKTKKLA